MNLSRPLLRAISNMNYITPTPIQQAAIPVGLLGRDICACAATGTGKRALNNSELQLRAEFFFKTKFKLEISTDLDVLLFQTE